MVNYCRMFSTAGYWSVERPQSANPTGKRSFDERCKLQVGIPLGTAPDVPGGQSITATLPNNQREIQFALKWNF